MNAPLRNRPLALGPIRAFEAVARRLGFGAAAEELHLTQSAVSRQIRALEDEVGVVLFSRGTRHVELTAAGAALLRAVAPALDRIDAGVRQVRQARGRRIVNVTTFASFATLWLIPRLAAFQREQPAIDIRVGASDALIDPEAGEAAEVDVALRCCRPAQAPPGSLRLFDEWLSPVASPWLLAHAKANGPPLDAPADLARHALVEEDDPRPSSEALTWARWLREQGLGGLQPARWIYFNYTHQQVQAALAGQGLALARLPLTLEALDRGDLVEPFAHRPGTRIGAPNAYWMVTAPDRQAQSADVRCFCDWVAAQGAATREALARRMADTPLDDATAATAAAAAS